MGGSLYSEPGILSRIIEARRHCRCDFERLISERRQYVELACKTLGLRDCPWCGKPLTKDPTTEVEEYLNQYRQNGFYEDTFMEVPRAREKTGLT